MPSTDTLVAVAGASGVPSEVDGAVRSLGRRLIVASLLFMPLCDLSLLFWLVPTARFPGWQWILTAMAAPVVTWCAWPFYTAAARHLRRRTFSMDSLVSLGILVSTGWSVYSVFWQRRAVEQHSVFYSLTHHTDGAIYIDVAAGVTTFLLAGRFFEAWTKRRTRNSLRSLAAVGATWVSVVEPDGTERRLPASALGVGQEFVVRPSDTVATDGRVVSGRASLDRSAMTGESLPIEVVPGDSVLGGTVSLDGRLVVRAEKVGRDTQLSQMVQLVDRAQSEKASVQRLADRIAGVFVPVVLLIACVTMCGWLLSGAGGDQALNAALSVLVIACPCALGLATPMALMVASGEGARFGIFFKGYQGIEASRQVDTVVLDKTGTVTTGAMAVSGVCAVAGVRHQEVLAWAGSVERSSEHLVARAIANAAGDELTDFGNADDFMALPGLGARGRVRGHEVLVARPSSWPVAAIPDDVNAARVGWESRGQTVVLVARDDSVLGAIALSDAIRPYAAAAVSELHSQGLHCILLTGDNRCVAEGVAAAIGIDDVVSDALPTEKVDVVTHLRAAGHTVAMVGDGINDGPALATADLGLAVGSGTDVARNAADLIAVRDDLRIVPVAIGLARRTLRTIRGNLAWAFAYNLAVIPLAASGFLNPLIAGAAMALSSAFVVWNSAQIGRHLEPPTAVPARTPEHPKGDDMAVMPRSLLL